MARGLGRLLLQSVPQGVLDPADRVLNFAGSYFVPTLDIKLGVTRGLAHSFFHSALGLFDGSFDAISVRGLCPLFLRRPVAQSIVGPAGTPRPRYGRTGVSDRIGIYSGPRNPQKRVLRDHPGIIAARLRGPGYRGRNISPRHRTRLRYQ